MNKSQMINFNDIKCVRLESGRYTALIAYELGSNCIRLRDNVNEIDFLRFDEDNTHEILAASAEVWGFPTLYLPNRFADGVLTVSDGVYNLPVNAADCNCHLHGFLHKRAHKVAEQGADNNCAWVKTEYIYDDKDEFYRYFPVSFHVEYTYTLSECGLEQTIRFTNLSTKMLPMTLCAHTAMKSPFVDGAKESDIRITVPIGKKCELNERCLPTERLKGLVMYDIEYRTGNKCPVLQNISNDMYTAEGKIKLDGGHGALRGVMAEDLGSGKKICYEVSEEYKFWIIWNDGGFKGYFCPEPMTAMIDAPNLSLPNEVTGYCEIKPGEKYETHQRFFSFV